MYFTRQHVRQCDRVVELVRFWLHLRLQPWLTCSRTYAFRLTLYWGRCLQSCWDSQPTLPRCFYHTSIVRSSTLKPSTVEADGGIDDYSIFAVIVPSLTILFLLIFLVLWVNLLLQDLAVCLLSNSTHIFSPRFETIGLFILTILWLGVLPLLWSCMLLMVPSSFGSMDCGSSWFPQSRLRLLFMGYTTSSHEERNKSASQFLRLSPF